MFLRFAVTLGVIFSLSLFAEDRPESDLGIGRSPSVTEVETIHVTAEEPAQKNVQVCMAPAYAEPALPIPSREANAVVLAAEESSRSRWTPLVGTTQFVGLWNRHIVNYLTVGAIYEVPLNSFLALELEGAYGRSNISYLSRGHDFDLYTLGGAVKLEPLRGFLLSPYLGAGMVANGFYGMSLGPRYPGHGYNAWIASVDAVAGLNLNLTRKFALGVRTEFMVPTLGKPDVGPSASAGWNPDPGFEEAVAISTNFVRCMATASFTL